MKLSSEATIDANIKTFTAILNRDPDNLKALYERGSCLNLKGEYTKAIEDYTRALEIDAIGSRFRSQITRFDTHQQIRDALEAMDREDDDWNRIETLTIDLEINPNDLLSRCERADRFAQVSAYRAAIDDLSIALKNFPNEPERLLLHRGRLFDAIEAYDQAEADFTASIAIHPSNPDAFNNRGLVHRKSVVLFIHSPK